MKNLNIYRIRSEAIPDTPTMQEALSQHPARDCGATEAMAVGFVPALEHGSMMVHNTSRCIIVRCAIQKKTVPPRTLRELLEKQVAAIQEKEGRKVGKKEMNRLRDELHLSLMPRAFPATHHYRAYIFHGSGLVIVEGSPTQAEIVLNALRLAFGSLPVARPAFNRPVPESLTFALANDAEGGSKQLFAGTPDLLIGDVAKFADEDGTITLSGHSPEGHAIAEVTASMKVTKLAIGYKDEATFVVDGHARLSAFRLTEFKTGQIEIGGDAKDNEASELEVFGVVASSAVECLYRELGEVWSTESAG